MISRQTKDKIIETARIEEVVGDFVVLKKKSGAYLMGLCPFHNEKTPSFTVTPAKGIYKCFGCGKSGGAVDFIMEHEHLTFPEALTYLANKYQIEIEAEIVSDEEKERRKEEENETESLLVVSSFAQKFFTSSMNETEEGKSVGLSYFKERGFHEDTIKKFLLGYSPELKNALSKAAIAEAYQIKYLVQSGVSILPEGISSADDGAKDKLIDRFRGRVMFPIQHLSGRVIGFGGRILGSDKKTAKYLNSPDSLIYHKSQVLYGMYQAKSTIITKDICYLVEGYTDVISMHQAGIENVVASSGTSLTTEQIRLIGRYTQNVTILYDGDPAGIKASMRGIDMILEEGLNVRIVLFPDGEDPDSFARKKSGWEVQEFITKQAQDIILFKAQMLLDEAGTDPVKKAGVVRNIMESIARIQDPIVRAEYTKMLSVKMVIAEQILITEMNKVRAQHLKKITSTNDLDSFLPEVSAEVQETIKEFNLDHQEKDILRILVNFGYVMIVVEESDSSGTKYFKTVTVGDFILDDFRDDYIYFENKIFKGFLEEYGQFFKNNGHDTMDSVVMQDKLIRHFASHENIEFRSFAASLLSEQHVLHNWKKFNIHIPQGNHLVAKDVQSAIYALKMKKIQQKIDKIVLLIKDVKEEDVIMDLQKRKMRLDELKSMLGKIVGSVVSR